MPHSNDQTTVSKELFLKKLPSLRPLSMPFLLVGHLSCGATQRIPDPGVQSMPSVVSCLL